MTYRGRIENGVVRFEAGSPFAEGTTVEVAPVATPVVAPAAKPSEQSWADVFEDVIGKAEGLPSDMAKIHDHYIHGSPKR